MRGLYFFSVLMFLIWGSAIGQLSDEYSYTGSVQTFTVPSCVESINVKIWGAGGGAGNNAGQGGAGAYVSGTISVTGGQTLAVVVGGGGQYANSASSSASYGGGGAGGDWGGSGGGYSGIFLNSVTKANALAIAGGGGGGANNWGYNTTQGKGGSQVNRSGGGSDLVGSAGGATRRGGGGGGYVGGSSLSTNTGGYGGTSYVNSGSLSITAGGEGSGTAPGNTENGYLIGVGVGGQSGQNGGNGRVIISYLDCSGAEPEFDILDISMASYCLNLPNQVTISVENTGDEVENTDSYVVQYKWGLGGTYANSTAVVKNIDENETKEYTFNITPPTVGTQDLYVQIINTADGNDVMAEEHEEFTIKDCDAENSNPCSQGTNSTESVNNIYEGNSYTFNGTSGGYYYTVYGVSEGEVYTVENSWGHWLVLSYYEDGEWKTLTQAQHILFIVPSGVTFFRVFTYNLPNTAKDNLNCNYTGSAGDIVVKYLKYQENDGDPASCGGNCISSEPPNATLDANDLNYTGQQYFDSPTLGSCYLFEITDASNTYSIANGVGSSGTVASGFITISNSSDVIVACGYIPFTFQVDVAGTYKVSVWRDEDCNYPGLGMEGLGGSKLVFQGGVGETPLPVELIAFNGFAQKDGNQLEWITASEKNSDYYLLESSTDGAVFSVIAKIPGAGNTDVESNYSFLDRQEQESEITYYHLKQMDFDGKVNNHGVISIKRNLKDKMLISPNPFTDQLKVSFKAQKDDNYSFLIYNTSGNLVYNNEFNVSKGNNFILLNLKDEIVKGFYILKIINSEGEIIGIEKLINKH